MDSCTVTLSGAPAVPVRLVFTDVNRLRWAIAALRVNADLRAVLRRAAQAGAAPILIESLALQREGLGLLPDVHAAGAPVAWIVLWDGLNSLIELWQCHPALRERSDLRYLHVGQLPEVDAALPAGSMGLYPLDAPLHAPLHAPLDAAPVAVPWPVRARLACRRALRPWLNRLRQPERHQRLSAGGWLVFCGGVRPSQMTLDDLFRDGVLPALRQALQPLAGLPWDTQPEATRCALQQAFGHLRTVALGLVAAPPSPPLPAARTPAEWACLYTALNQLHRIGTLMALQASTPRLFVNEFQVHPHFDPYDAQAYGRNLFLDFGSTRGTEVLYPRRLDMAETRKPVASLRLLAPGESVAAWFCAHDWHAFWRRCDDDALAALTTLSALVALDPLATARTGP